MRVDFDPSTGAVIGHPVPVTEESLRVGSVEPSPDGESLAFHRVGAQEDIFVSDADGTGVRRLTNDSYFDRFPRWTPDGPGSASFRTVVADTNSGPSTRTEATPAAHRRPETSPRNPRGLPTARACVHGLRNRLFHHGGGGPVREGTAGADGRNRVLRRVLLVARRELAGRSMASTSRRTPYETGLYIYSLESGHYERLTTGGSNPRWFDDSRTLVYADRGAVYTVDRIRQEVRSVLSLDDGDLLLPHLLPTSARCSMSSNRR